MTIEAGFKEQRPVVLSTPLKGKYWTAIYNCEWKRGHRRGYYTVNGKSGIPGRFAIDFVRLDDKGKLYHQNKDFVKNYYSYGEDVLAGDDAIVVSLKDGFSESETISGYFTNGESDASGNYLALQVRNVVYVFYEHLQPGGIRFKVGDRVKKGQVVARVGFTGDASEPHLHLHVGDSDSVLGAEGLPFVLRNLAIRVYLSTSAILEKSDGLL
ncbi:M23 family metallopeptidase [Niabella yanshanensis]|uniref:M23 family metallopeptidase n=1 Tax=Niabella yanshanensis TaxID=577386 RepID=A0ABZ0WB23_9BACT|nr:M23 family metallopeptidase [Niabella yanshanensis]WQD39672.1 M23 family metallopeptidase [Niabella yanshanensis]